MMRAVIDLIKSGEVATDSIFEAHIPPLVRVEVELVEVSDVDVTSFTQSFGDHHAHPF